MEQVLPILQVISLSLPINVLNIQHWLHNLVALCRIIRRQDESLVRLSHFKRRSKNICAVRWLKCLLSWDLQISAWVWLRPRNLVENHVRDQATEEIATAWCTTTTFSEYNTSILECVCNVDFIRKCFQLL